MSDVMPTVLEVPAPVEVLEFPIRSKMPLMAAFRDGAYTECEVSEVLKVHIRLAFRKFRSESRYAFGMSDFVSDRRDGMRIIEVKRSWYPSHVQTGVGQLMLARCESPAAKLYLAAPGIPPPRVTFALRTLGIALVVVDMATKEAFILQSEPDATT